VTHVKQSNICLLSAPLEKHIWRIVRVSLEYLHQIIINIVSNWFEWNQIRIGICALLLTTCDVRRDLVFNKLYRASFLQVITLTTHSTRMWLRF
jgi:hypothetical protein